MNTDNPIIASLITVLLILIPLGAVVRIVLCAVAMMMDDEKKGENKRRIRNVLAFVVFAEVAVSLIALVYHYYE